MVFALGIPHELGTLPAWLTLASLVAVGYYVVRGQGGAALSIMRDANTVLADRVKQLEAAKNQDLQRITELEATRSLEAVITQVAKLVEGQRTQADERLQVVMAELQTNERRAQDRHESLLGLVATTGAEIVAGIRRATDGPG